MIFADIDIDNGNDIYVPHRGLEAVLGKTKLPTVKLHIFGYTSQGT